LGRYRSPRGGSLLERVGRYRSRRGRSLFQRGFGALPLAARRLAV
jgi:hypothetical protein